MLIDIVTLKSIFGSNHIDTTHLVMQIGAHKAEEHQIWITLGFKEFIYVEPIPEVVRYLEEKFKEDSSVKLKEVAVSDSQKDLTFYVWSPTYISSSKELTVNSLELSSDFKFVKTIRVPTITLDSLIAENRIIPSMLVIDVQGSEFEILEPSRLLDQIPIVLIELLYDELYINQADAYEIKSLMSRKGFVLAVESFDETGKWSDAAFLNSNFIKKRPHWRLGSPNLRRKLWRGVNILKDRS